MYQYILVSFFSHIQGVHVNGMQNPGVKSNELPLPLMVGHLLFVLDSSGVLVIS